MISKSSTSAKVFPSFISFLNVYINVTKCYQIWVNVTTFAEEILNGNVQWCSGAWKRFFSLTMANLLNKDHVLIPRNRLKEGSATNWKVHSVPHIDVLPQLISNQSQLNKINLNAMEITGSNGKKFQAFLPA